MEIYQLLFSRSRGILEVPFSSTIDGFTTLNLNGNIYRGHPWFNPALPWYDYAYINWEGDSDDITDDVEVICQQRLAKILCFLDLSNHEIKQRVLDIDHRFKGQCVLVQSILETDVADGYTPTARAMNVMKERNLPDRLDKLLLVTAWELEND